MILQSTNNALIPDQGLPCPQLLLLAQTLTNGLSAPYTSIGTLCTQPVCHWYLVPSLLWDNILPMEGCVGFCIMFQK